VRVVRHREVQRKTAATARKLAEMQARTDATLQRSYVPIHFFCYHSPTKLVSRKHLSGIDDVPQIPTGPRDRR